MLAGLLLLAVLPLAPAGQNLPRAATTLIVHPPEITLDGPRATHQLVVTGNDRDGSACDLTGTCELTSDNPAVAVVESGGLVRARGNGTTALVIRARGQTARVPVTVRDFDRPRPISFRQEVIAALNVGGCNQGACHGTPAGKNGFKLSLRGYDPAADHEQLTRDLFGRRTTSASAESGLIWLKALGRVPHEGGQRFAPTSDAALALRTWLSEGLRDDRPDLPALTRLEIVPGARVLRSPARTPQLAVLAHFADGSVRDVTRLAVFSSSDPAVADVSPTGRVTFRQPGEVAILCRYLQSLQTV